MEPWISRDAIEKEIAYYRQLDALVQRRLAAAPHEAAATEQQLRQLWGSDLIHLSRDHARQMLDYYEGMLTGR